MIAFTHKGSKVKIISWFGDPKLQLVWVDTFSDSKASKNFILLSSLRDECAVTDYLNLQKKESNQ